MRDTGSVWKKSRYLNMSVTETGKELKKRAYAPGQHGANKKRKTSEYGKQLLDNLNKVQVWDDKCLWHKDTYHGSDVPSIYLSDHYPICAEINI